MFVVLRAMIHDLPRGSAYAGIESASRSHLEPYPLVCPAARLAG